MKDTVVPFMNKDGTIDWFKDTRFAGVLLLCVLFANRVLVSVLFRLPFIRRFRATAAPLNWSHYLALLAGATVVTSYIYSQFVEPVQSIDSAMHAFMGKMPDLEVLEGEQVADAVLEWANEAQKEHHPLLRKHIHWALISETCEKQRGEMPHLKDFCKRDKAYESLDFGSINVNGIEHKLNYFKNPNATLEDELEEGRLETRATEICERLVPPMNNCEVDIAKHMKDQYVGFERDRASSKKMYKRLGVLADASAGEIYMAAGRTMSKLGSNFAPFARVDNGTSVHHKWDKRVDHAHAISAGLAELMVEKDREWYDKPCEPVFGGAMCAKKDAAGNMMIEMGGGED